MSAIDTTTTLAALVTAHPALARDLERLGLDYCCRGRRSLAEACAERGLEAEQVADDLGRHLEPSGEAAWASMAPDALVDHLEATHHRDLHAELPRLAGLADRVVAAHVRRHPELGEVRATYADLHAELVPHLMKEERVLFPMVRALVAASEAGEAPPAAPGGSVHAPISVMLAEHDRAGELLAELRRRTDGYRPPDDACASFRALYAGFEELERDTHLHVHKESNVLFPAVEALEAEAGGVTGPGR